MYSNIKNKPSASLRTATFGVLLVITFILIGLYLPSYVANNPPACQQEATVEEILAISRTKAKVKLSDGSIINTKIETYDNQNNKFKNELKLNQNICLEYKNPLVYYLLYILER